MAPKRVRPHRILSVVRIEQPFPMVVVVPIDPTGELPPAPPLLGLIRCSCTRCNEADFPAWIRIPPGFMRRLLIPGPEQGEMLDKLRERFPWAA